MFAQQTDQGESDRPMKRTKTASSTFPPSLATEDEPKGEDEVKKDEDPESYEKQLLLAEILNNGLKKSRS